MYKIYLNNTTNKLEFLLVYENRGWYCLLNTLHKAFLEVDNGWRVQNEHLTDNILLFEVSTPEEAREVITTQYPELFI